MSAKLEDIARIAGVSKMTVSRVLREQGGFSDETRQRVTQVAQELGYIPNRIAAAFGTEASSTLIGICVPRMAAGMIGQLLEGVDHALRQQGYQLMIGTSDDCPKREAEWLRQLVSWRPAGVILFGARHEAAMVDLLRHKQLPVVELWDLPETPIDMAIGYDHRASGREMAEHLLGRGKRRIGYVGLQNGAGRLAAARFEGFCQPLAQAGHPLVDAEFLHDSPGFYAGYYGLETLLARGQSFDTVYFHNDEMAMGGIALCQSRGLHVPDEIAIAGWGGMEAASILPRRLTTTLVQTTPLGEMAAKALIGRLQGAALPKLRVLPSKLIAGESV